MAYSNGWDVQVAHSVEEIGQEAWDRLAASRPFASYRWYRFGETVLAGSLPVYIILSQKGEPLARATFWLTRQEALPIPSGPIRLVLNTLIRRWPLLVCRSPLSYTSGLILPKGLLRDVALETITRVAQDQTRQRRVSFLLFDYLERELVEQLNWPEYFWATTAGDPDTRLLVTWSDFESYLGHLSKNMRKQYHRNCNRAASLGIEVKSQPIVQPLDETTLNDATRLIQNVDKRKKSSSNPWTRRMLEFANMVDAIWLTTQLEGQRVGCSILLGDGHTDWRWTLVGLDYTVRYTYFQLIYTAIECAIQQGVQVLWGGAGSEETKRRLGLELVHNNMVVVATGHTWLQQLGRFVSARM